jgi:predicted GNAT superfamily acetyltransferase
MAVAPGPKEAKEFHLRRVGKPEEFRAVEEVQREAWGLGAEVPVPGAVQRGFQDNGGLVLGAFVDIYLAGFTMSFLGWDGSSLYHYSHLTGIRPEYQNHHVGLRLKLFQREEVQRQGLNQIRWVFDPLQSRNAHVAIRRLGGVPDRYLVHYFGQLDSAANAGIETDRLRLVWDLAAPRTEERIAGKFPTPAEDAARWRRSTAILETKVGDSGIRLPAAVDEPTAAEVHLEVPFDLRLVREHEPAALRTWRHAGRDAFRAAFDAGYRIDDFAVVSEEHERRSFYFLRAGSPSARAGEGALPVDPGPSSPGSGTAPPGSPRPD